MTKKLLYLFTVLCTLSFFTACGDDDKDPIDPNVLDVNSVYSGENLDLKYSNVQLLGKNIRFETKDGKTGTILMEGTFDMSILTELLSSKSLPYIPKLAPGVIPGELTTTLSNVPLTLSGEKYTFEGTDSQNGREVKYTGSVEKDKLILSLNVTMPGNDLTGAWKTAPIVPGDEWGGANKSQPLNMVWKADATIDLSAVGFGQLPVPAIATLAGGLLSPELLEVLESITFQTDGNIVASYKKKNATGPVTSPINLAQYYIKNKKLYLQLNITQILATVEANKSKADNPLNIIKLIEPLIPYFSEGVPMTYGISDGAVQITLGQDVLKSVLAVATNPTIGGLILGAIKGDNKELIQGIFVQLPGILQKTEDINISLRLVK